jgi:hypothetical protein
MSELRRTLANPLLRDCRIVFVKSHTKFVLGTEINLMQDRFDLHLLLLCMYVFLTLFTTEFEAREDSAAETELAVHSAGNASSIRPSVFA